jgi:hypothetical protein
MILLRRLIPVTLVALSIAVAGAGAQGGALEGIVGPGFTIRLQTPDGARVNQLQVGTYTITVDDRSSDHNFHLVGPGVDQSTGVDAIGKTTWTVTLSTGQYNYFCDPHAFQMKGDFTVGNAAPPPPPPPPPPSPPPPPPPAAKKINAKVGPGATIGVLRGTVRVRALAAGVYLLTVRDLSARDNFHLIGPGVNRRTTVAGRVTRMWRLALGRGVYRYRSDAHPTLRGSFTVR